MLQLLKANTVFSKYNSANNHTADKPLTAEETGLADYKGYEVYNDLYYELSSTYYGDNSDWINDKDSYIYKYMTKKYPDLNVDEIEKEYEEKRDEVRKAFEEDVASGKIKITIPNDGRDVEVLDISEFNRNYDMSNEEIRGSNAAERDGNAGDCLNTVVVKVDDSTIMLVEGSRANSDPDDWVDGVNPIYIG